MIGNKIRGIGEIVLRVKDMEIMREFYVQTLGFELIRGDDHYTFLKLAEGHRGHTQILALFNAENETAFGKQLESVDHNSSPLHHLALEIDLEDYEVIHKELNEKNIPCVMESFNWVKWKSIFIQDPEGNIVEFVCYDPNIK